MYIPRRINMTALMYAIIVVYVIITIFACMMMLAAMAVAGGALWYLLLTPAWPVFLGYVGGRYVYRYATDYEGQMKLLSTRSDEQHEQAVRESEAKRTGMSPSTQVTPNSADAAAREKAIAPALAITVAAVPATIVAK